jgi:hypothetical protein
MPPVLTARGWCRGQRPTSVISGSCGAAKGPQRVAQASTLVRLSEFLGQCKVVPRLQLLVWPSAEALDGLRVSSFLVCEQ